MFFFFLPSSSIIGQDLFVCVLYYMVLTLAGRGSMILGLRIWRESTKTGKKNCTLI